MKLTKELLESTLKDFNINILDIFEFPNEFRAVVGNNERLPDFIVIPSKFILSILNYENVKDLEIKGGAYVPMMIIRCYINTK